MKRKEVLSPWIDSVTASEKKDFNPWKAHSPEFESIRVFSTLAQYISLLIDVRELQN